jgi:hypothetical protein
MLPCNKLRPAEKQRVVERERQEDRADLAQHAHDPKLAEQDPAYQRYLREFPRNDPRD